jgi:thymidine kinase
VLYQYVCIALVALGLYYAGPVGLVNRTRTIILGGRIMKLVTIYGPMFSEKTIKLIDLIAQSQDNGALIFKHARDVRSDGFLSSHNPRITNRVPAIPIYSLYQVMEYVTAETRHVFVDEVQFFDMAHAAKTLAMLREKFPEVTLVVSGLDRNWKGEEWPTMRYFRDQADERILCRTNCQCCGGMATHSYLIEHASIASVEVIGGAGTYEPRCETCYTRGMAPV